MGQKAREKMQKRLAALRPPPWTPFERSYYSPEDLAKMKLTRQPDVFRNSRYQVNVRRLPDDALRPMGMLHLSIKRLDKEPIHDWRDLQRIKNELCGPEREAVEVYPAESRLVDEANQFHLWVYPAGYRLPFGFADRLVSEDVSVMGGKQRPFEPDAKPADMIQAGSALSMRER